MEELKEIAAVVDSTYTSTFPKQLVSYTNSILPFHAATMFIFGNAKPIHLFNNFQGQKSQRGITEFIQATYVLNPFYQAHRRGLESGVYRLSELAPDVFFDSEFYKRFRVKVSASEESGYVTRDWPEGLTEIDIAVRLSDTETALIALFRKSGSGGFLEIDIDALRERLPFVVAATKAFWRAQDSSFRSSGRVDEEGKFGEGTITEREREVLEFVLRGHSSESIAIHLGISVTTVKTHRKNAYEKLGISTQAELFNVFLQHHHVTV